MTSKNIAIMTGVLFFMLSGAVASQDWVDIKNPKELRALHSNKTFRSMYGGVPMVEHFRADGKGIRVCGELRESFTWEIKGDQVCVPYPDYLHCWQFQHSKKHPGEYVRRDPKVGATQMIKVEDGIPEF